ncbi:MAG: acyloxyacyl hydrolase [Bacteroidales bacterium]
MHRVIALILLVSINTLTKAENNASDSIKSKSIAINLYSGILQHHHREMEILREKRVFALEITHLFTGNGSKQWHSFYGFPQFGVSYKFIDLGSPNILGYAHCLYPFVNFPIQTHMPKWNAIFKVGPGLGYVTKTYHRTDNFKNSAISTHLNAYINFGFMAAYKLSSNLTLHAGINLSHFSNGTVKKPNSGLNYTMINLGGKYSYQSQTTNNKQHYTFSDKKNRLLLAGIGSQKEIKGAGGPKYGVKSFSIEYSRAFRTLLRYGVSLDIMDDKSNEFILDYEEVAWDNESELLKIGTAASAEFILNRVSAILYFGGYIYNKANDSNDGYVYQRLGIRYRFTNRFYGHLALKTHWGSADYLEIGGAIKLY